MDRDTPGSGKAFNVLRFRRRGQSPGPLPRASVPLSPPRSPVEDTGKYERSEAERDDYRHRMLMNAAALAICTMLVVTGVWIANKLAEIRRDQDCVLAGRRNCAQLQLTGPER